MQPTSLQNTVGKYVAWSARKVLTNMMDQHWSGNQEQKWESKATKNRSGNEREPRTEVGMKGNQEQIDNSFLTPSQLWRSYQGEQKWESKETKKRSGNQEEKWESRGTKNRSGNQGEPRTEAGIKRNQEQKWELRRAGMAKGDELSQAQKVTHFLLVIKWTKWSKLICLQAFPEVSGGGGQKQYRHTLQSRIHAVAMNKDKLQITMHKCKWKHHRSIWQFSSKCPTT